MRRFYLASTIPPTGTIQLDKEQSRHISTVLRLQAGEKITLFDGQGNDIYATLLIVKKNGVHVQITGTHHVPLTKPIIHLHLGLLKGKKMEFIIQKMTELGIDHIHPFTCDFSDTALPSARKMERWQKICLEACKQCGRARTIHIAKPVALTTDLASEKQGTVVTFWEGETKKTISDIPTLLHNDEIHFFIGPEGGFSASEINLFNQQNIATLSLGDLTLRAETAVLCATTLILHQANRLQPRKTREEQD